MFVLVVLIFNMNVTSASILFSVYLKTIASFSFQTETSKTIFKVSQAELPVCCKSGLNIVTSSNWVTNVETVALNRKLKVGQPRTKLTPIGNVPAWSTVRQRFWKNESFLNIRAYSVSNLSGVPPLTRVPHDLDQSWEDFFAQLPADTLSVFFFNSDTMVAYSFEEIRVNYNIMVRKDIDLKYLQDNEYTITYP